MSIILRLFALIQIVSSSKLCPNKEDARATLDGCMLPEIDTLRFHDDCISKDGYKNKICIFDISSLNQAQVSGLLGKLISLRPRIKCDNSALMDLDFTHLEGIGNMVKETDKLEPKENEPAMVIVNNMHLKTIDFGKTLMQNWEHWIMPGFWTILNNPRLTRYSIDTINDIVKRRETEQTQYRFPISDVKTVFPELIKMQKYGDCDFHFTNSSKTSLSWEEFRWCRTISHEVILEGADFDPKEDTAYIHKMTGPLKISNTNIENLNFLPVYFGVDSDGNGTTCHSTGLSMQEVLNLKDCVTLKGGLKLDAIDESAAAADLFKTVKVIEGSLEITNAKATIDFRKLEKITGGSDQKNIFLKGCSHPILFPSLKTLEGSTSVVMENCRMDAYKYLKEKYKESIVDLSRVVTTTTNAPTAAPGNAPAPSQPNAVDQRITPTNVVVTDKETTAQSVDHDESTKKPGRDSPASSTEPGSITEGQGTSHPSPPEMAQDRKGNTSDNKGEDESTSGSKTTLMIIAGLAGAVFLLTSVAIAVILLKCAVF